MAPAMRHPPPVDHGPKRLGSARQAERQDGDDGQEVEHDADLQARSHERCDGERYQRVEERYPGCPGRFAEYEPGPADGRDQDLSEEAGFPVGDGGHASDERAREDGHGVMPGCLSVARMTRMTRMTPPAMT